METALIKVFAFVCIIIAGYWMGHTGKLGQHARRVRVEDRVHVHAALRGAARVRRCRLLAGDAAARALGFAFAFGAYLVAFAITPRAKRSERAFYLLNACGFNLGCFALPFVQAIFSAHYGRGHLPLRLPATAVP